MSSQKYVCARRLGSLLWELNNALLVDCYLLRQHSNTLLLECYGNTVASCWLVVVLTLCYLCLCRGTE